jgi:MFS family permease
MVTGLNGMTDAATAPMVRAEGRDRSGNWGAVVIFLILYAFAYLDRQVLGLLVDPIRADLGISDFQISVLQGAAFVLFFAICSLPIGWAVDRYPRRPIIFFGIVIWSLAASAGGLARNFWQLLLCRFGVGAGEASLSPSVYSMLSDLFPKERLAGAMAVYSTGSMIGMAISLAIGGVVVSLAKGAEGYMLPLIGNVRPWQLVFLLTGLPGLVFACIIFLVREPQRRGRIGTDGQRPPFGAIIPFLRGRWRFYAAHIGGFSIFTMVLAAFTAWTPTILMRKFGLGAAQTGFTLGGLTLVCGVTGLLCSGMLVDRLFRRGVADAHLRVYAIVALICGVAGVTAMLATNFYVAIGAMTVIKTLSPFIAVAATALQITTPSEYRGQVSALFLFVYNIVGFGFGPSVVAGISDFLIGGGGDISLAMACTFAVATPITAVVFFLGLRPMRRAVAAARSWDTPGIT